MTQEQQDTFGFDVIWRLLGEGARTGRSDTLDAWMAESKRRMAEYRKSGLDAKLTAQADRVGRAYDSAAKLVNKILAGELGVEKPPA